MSKLLSLFCFIVALFSPFNDDLQKKAVQQKALEVGRREGQGRRLAREGGCGFLPEA